MRRTCSGSAVPGCVVRLSTKLQTPGLPEGQKKGRLGFFSPLSSCPLFASRSTSLVLSFIPPLLFFPSLCYPGAGGNSCCTASTLASYTSSQAFPINHGRMLTTVCREELQTFWVSDFETSGFAKSLGKADNVSKSAVGMYVLRKSWPVSSIREYFTKATGPLTGVSPLWGKWGFRILLIGVAGGKMRNISYRIIVVPRAEKLVHSLKVVRTRAKSAYFSLHHIELLR